MLILAMFQQEIYTIQVKQSQHSTNYNEIKHKKQSYQEAK